MYRLRVESRVKRLIAECGWKRLRDVTPESFTMWRSGVIGFKPKTINAYLDSASSMMNWLYRMGRIVVNPLVTVERVDVRGTQQERRALTDDDVSRLLAVAGRRKMAYMLALNTGLRQKELRELQWGDVVLDATRPFIKARSKTTKNRKDAVLPLSPWLADELRRVRPVDVHLGRRVFKGVVLLNNRFRVDLAKAGISEYDQQQRKADFHAMRKTFGTNLHRAGVAPRVIMHLMRHSDMRLTNSIYTDVNALGGMDAVDLLACLTPSSVESIRTGTDDAQMNAQSGGISGHSPSLAVVGDGECGGDNALPSSHLDMTGHPLLDPEKRVTEGTRTPNPRHHKPML